MTLFIIMLIVLCVYRAKIYRKPDFCPDYLSLDKTMSIRGLFVLLSFLSVFPLAYLFGKFLHRIDGKII